MKPREPAAWTDQWIRELSWRTLRRMLNEPFDADAASRYERSRQKRLEAELARRKREGGGGWVAEIARRNIQRKNVLEDGK